jgi:hypothetical protein
MKLALFHILAPFSIILLQLVQLYASMQVNPPPIQVITITDMKIIKLEGKPDIELLDRNTNLLSAFQGTTEYSLALAKQMDDGPHTVKLINGYTATLTADNTGATKLVKIKSSYISPPKVTTCKLKAGSSVTPNQTTTIICGNPPADVTFKFPDDLKSESNLMQRPYVVNALPQGRFELSVDKWQIFFEKAADNKVTILVVEYVPNFVVKNLKFVAPLITFGSLVAFWSFVVIMIVKKFDREMYELGGGLYGVLTASDASSSDNSDLTDFMDNGELGDGNDGLQGPDDGSRSRADKRSLPSGRDASDALDDDMTDMDADANSDEVTQKTDARTFAFIASTLVALALLI